MNFLHKTHEQRYTDLKDKIGFSSDKGEYASLVYLLTSDLLFSKINDIFDIHSGLKTTEIEKVKEVMATGEIVLLDLAFHLFRKEINGDSINKIFSNLDAINSDLALDAIRISYGKATF